MAGKPHGIQIALDDRRGCQAKVLTDPKGSHHPASDDRTGNIHIALDDPLRTQLQQVLRTQTAREPPIDADAPFKHHVALVVCARSHHHPQSRSLL
jgi:hypothetical protein